MEARHQFFDQQSLCPMIEFRMATAADVQAIRAFVVGVVTEVYGHLIDDVPSTITSDALWADSLLVFVDQKLVGVGLTIDDLVDDIWLSADARGAGIGTELLHRLERQIVERGYLTARLRVVGTNQRACRFYESRGWIAGRSYKHERLGLDMIDYSKAVRG